MERSFANARASPRPSDLPPYPNAPRGSPCLALIPNDQRVVVVDAAGEHIREIPLPWAASAQKIADLDGWPTPTLVLGSPRGGVLGVDLEESKDSRRRFLKGPIQHLIAGDLDGDGKPEILVLTKAGEVAAIRGNGDILWRANIGQKGYMLELLPARAGRAGRVFVSSSNEVFCIDAKGEIVWVNHSDHDVHHVDVFDCDGAGRDVVAIVSERAPSRCSSPPVSGARNATLARAPTRRAS